ncbi:MAG: hypothetical protein JXQ90_14955 [Cyclobacteriaceae bacterium]
MSTEEYYHVFETILLAGVLTLIVQGWSKLYIHRHEYRFNLSYLMGAVEFAIVIVWKYFLSRNFAIYEIIDTPIEFLGLVFIPAASLLMGAYIYFPESYKDIDMNEHLVKNRFWFCQNVIIMLAMVTLNLHLVDALTMDLLIVNTGISVLLVAFVVTGNLKIWHSVMAVGPIVLAFYLLQDSEYYQIF